VTTTSFAYAAPQRRPWRHVHRHPPTFYVGAPTSSYLPSLADRRDEVTLAPSSASPAPFRSGRRGRLAPSATPSPSLSASGHRREPGQADTDVVDLYTAPQGPTVPSRVYRRGDGRTGRRAGVRHLVLSASRADELLRQPSRSTPRPPCRANVQFGVRDFRPNVCQPRRTRGVGFRPYSPLGRGSCAAIVPSRSDLAPDRTSGAGCRGSRRALEHGVVDRDPRRLRRAGGHFPPVRPGLAGATAPTNWGAAVSDSVPTRRAPLC